MKKVLITILMLAGISLLFADLEVNIPFDQNIVGPSYAEQGDYEYVSEWITLTTTGTESYTYHFMYSYENMPANWSMSICNPVTCFMPNFNTPIELGPGEVEQIHIVVNVTSANGFNFNFLIRDGDLTEPISLDFTFRTADFSEAADNELVNEFPVLMQNYPNPFKIGSSTSISFNIARNDAKDSDISIYNIKGQKIRTLESLECGNHVTAASTRLMHSTKWNGKDENGHSVEPGIYFYKLTAGTEQAVKKLLLIP